MERRNGDRTSPRSTARLAGALELLTALTSAGGQQVILGMLLVPGNEAATVDNVLAHEALFRAGAALVLVGVVFNVAWGIFMYDLLRVVNRTVALFTLGILVVGSAIAAISGILYLAPLAVLQVGGHVVSDEGSRSLAFAALRWNGLANDVFLAFFGGWLIPTGYLIFRSGSLPRVIGVLLMLDGVGWSTFVWPPLGLTLFPLIALFSGLGEIPLMGWLLFRGVDSERWKAATAAMVER